MIWKKLSIDTTVEVVDLLSDFLGELGIEGIQIEDNVPLTDDEIKQMFIDIPLTQDENDGSSTVSCFLDDTFDDSRIEDIKNAVSEELDRLEEFLPVGSKSITVTETSDDSTWNDKFKEYFKPTRLYDDIVILPAWETFNEIRPEDKVIKIESVMAFGTGTHETTRLCLGELKKYIGSDKSVFDIGCGSGILSIAACLMGAGYVHGLDIDPQAVEASVINAKANDLSVDRIDFTCGNLFANNKTAEEYLENDENAEKVKKASLGSGISSPITAAQMVDLELGDEDTIPARRYDIVVANILADVIIPLASIVRDYMTDDGVFISSGISETRVDEVKQALIDNGFKIIDLVQENEWVAIVSK